MPRKTAKTLPPIGREDAAVLLGNYAASEHEAARIRVEASEAIADIEARRDALLAPISAQQKVRFAALKDWWTRAGAAEAGKKRSDAISGALIGMRLGTPKVKFAKGRTGKTVLADLLGLRWLRKREFVRTAEELNKKAIIDVMSADEEVSRTFTRLGVSVVQDDEFFIDVPTGETAPIAKEGV